MCLLLDQRRHHRQARSCTQASLPRYPPKHETQGDPCTQLCSAIPACEYVVGWDVQASRAQLKEREAEAKWVWCDQARFSRGGGVLEVLVEREDWAIF